MAAERLSALQKWILIKCYQKTIKRDNSGMTILMKYRDTSELPANYWEYLYRDEILADYYKYPGDENGHPWHHRKKHVFTGDTAAGRIATDRSLASLEEKGLIELYKCVLYGAWQGVKLTAAGIDKALLLTCAPTRPKR